jgi:hypothetical protein
MEQPAKKSSRKKFLLWSLGIISSVTAIKLISPSQKKKNMVKMLTQDGKLVQIDKDLLGEKSKRQISGKELLSWIKK